MNKIVRIFITWFVVGCVVLQLIDVAFYAMNQPSDFANFLAVFPLVIILLSLRAGVNVTRRIIDSHNNKPTNQIQNNIKK
jgi:hypothetical protein